MKRFSRFLSIAALALACPASSVVAQIALNIGDIPSGQVVTITCEVTITNPLPAGVFAITNQGTFTGDNFSAQPTDDPDSFILNDPTVTEVPANLDFGDAPANYPVSLANDGARHVVPFGEVTVYLGSTPPDVDADGYSSDSADGDNTSGTNDEDGVLLPNAFSADTTAETEVIASAPGFLNAWIDFNRDGDWDDAGEQIATNLALVSGTNLVSISVPTFFAGGESFARFRFSSDLDLTPRGLASDGEVEDYSVMLNAAPVIAGMSSAQSVDDNSSLSPFSSASISDQHTPTQSLSATIVIDDAAKGQLGNLSDFVENPAGVYALNGTADEITTAIQQLTYTPTQNRVAPGSTETANFTVMVNDGFLTVTNTTTSIVSLSINDSPIDVALSNTSVDQEAGTNGVIGTLESTDVDNASFSYALVSGIGSTDNTLFNISGSTLRANDASLMAAGIYSVRIETDDGSGGTFAKAFQIEVLDTTPPSISIGAPAVAMTSAGPVNYPITYADADAVTLAAEDVTLNHTGSATGTVVVSGSGLSTRTVTLTNISGSGTLSISIAEGTASDLAANSAAGAGPSATVTVNSRPTVGVDAATLVIGEGSIATNTGTFADLEGNADVSISASAGLVTRDISGTWTWTFQATDGPEETQSVVVSAVDDFSTNSVSFELTVTNIAPLATSQNLTNAEDAILSLTLSATNPGNDSITNWMIVTSPTNGVLSGTAPDLVYTPATNFFGDDSFTFTATDSDGAESASATVSISVTPVNDLPVAGLDNIARPNTTRMVKVTRTSLLVNDSDVEGDALSLIAVHNPLPVGSTIELAGNFVVYVAPATNSGDGSFIYVLSDGVNLVTNLVTVTEISATPTGSGPNSAAIVADGNDFVLKFIGVPGHTYRVQFSTDLGAPYTWNEFNPLAIYTAPANGVFTHIDVNPPNTTRFYRAVPHP